MATFIFGENKINHPVLVSFEIGYKNVSIMQSAGVSEDGKTHNVIVLNKIEGGDARKALKQGIIVKNDNGDSILVKLKTVFIIEKLEVFYNEEKIHGHEFIYFKLI